MPSLTVVVPVLDDAEPLRVLLEQLRLASFYEIVVVDGGSADDPRTVAEAYGARYLEAPRGRARQMQAGVAATRSEWVWFLHADTRITRANVVALDWVIDRVQWGRFDVELSGDRATLRVIEFAMNWRSAVTGICTGDQGIFVRRSLLDLVGGVPQQALMEDIELSKRLRRYAAPARVRPPIVTSSRRWEQDGVAATVGTMWALRARYFFGADPEVLARRYYPRRVGSRSRSIE